MKEQNFELVIENGAVKGCKGEARKVVISENIVRIADSAFENCDFITEVDIRSSELKTVGNRAFKNCKRLKKCAISTLKGRIGNSAFLGCKSLERFDIPKGTVKIGDKAFYNCSSLKFISVPESVMIIDGKILNNDKTIIVGEENSAAHKYAKDNSVSFRSDYETVLEKTEKIKDFNKTLTVNLFDEKIVCYKSIEVFAKTSAFFNEVIFKKFYIKVLAAIPRKYGEKCRLRSLKKELEICIRDINNFMNEFGVFTKENYYKAARKYINLFNDNIDDFDDIYKHQDAETLNKMMETHSDIMNDEYAHVTGLGYGVVGGPMDLLMHGLDEAIALKKQYKEADKNISKRSAVAIEQIAQASSNEIDKMYAEVSEVVKETVLTVINGLFRCTCELFIEYKILDEKVLDNYSPRRANEIIEKVKSNIIDSKYGLTTALQYEPNNVEIIGMVLEQDFDKSDLITLIKLACFYDIADDILQVFISKYTLVELIDIDKNICGDLKPNEKEFFKQVIDGKARKLINDINNDYTDPTSVDSASWQVLVSEYEIILPKNKDAFNFSKEDLLSDEGKKLFAEAVAVKREEKERKDSKQRAIKETENKIEELQSKINSTNVEIGELKTQISGEEKEIKSNIKIGIAGIICVVGTFAAVPIWGELDLLGFVLAAILMLIGLYLCSGLCKKTVNKNKNEHMRMLLEKEAELNKLQQEYNELIKNKANNTVLCIDEQEGQK